MNALAQHIETAPRSKGDRWPAIAQFPELPPFERHVAMLLVEDASRALMASRLGVSRPTVYTATCKLLSKLDLSGVAGLTRLAIRRGYIQP